MMATREICIEETGDFWGRKSKKISPKFGYRYRDAKKKVLKAQQRRARPLEKIDTTRA
jgi:hypothetical protein